MFRITESDHKPGHARHDKLHRRKKLLNFSCAPSRVPHWNKTDNRLSITDDLGQILVGPTLCYYAPSTTPVHFAPTGRTITTQSM